MISSEDKDDYSRAERIVDRHVVLLYGDKKSSMITNHYHFTASKDYML